MNGNANEKSFKSLIDKSTLQHYTIHMPITEQFIESNNIKYSTTIILIYLILRYLRLTIYHIMIFMGNIRK